MTAGKTIALTRWTFVGKVMCPFNDRNYQEEDFHRLASLGYVPNNDPVTVSRE